MTKRIYVAYTGGTIGMAPRADGYAPRAGFLGQQLAAMPELYHPSLPAFELDEYDPLLDSANMVPGDWVRIAQDIARRYNDYDGFVVLHGTDTMAYSASALSFLLPGLAKPVILTGAQIPLCELRTDARENLIAALLLAAGEPIPEVCLFFGGRLLRGCRSVKVNASGFDAFDSPNYPPLGVAGIDLAINWPLVRRLEPAAIFKPLQPRLDTTVGALRLFPGISAQVVRNMLQPPLQGLVLEAYGTGNAPDRNRDLLTAIAEATERGVVIVDCTQCLRGTVDLEAYATGAALARAGVISGYDLTAEAALAKLFCLLGAGHSPEETRALMQQDLAGELTRP
jgi:L-asparaginase